MQGPVERVVRAPWRRARNATQLKELCELLRIPSVSAAATCAGDVHRGAEWVAGADPLGSRALVPGVSRPPDTPWVIGSIAAPRPHSARTVLI
jgi:hypothetical protein